MIKPLYVFIGVAVICRYDFAFGQKEYTHVYDRMTPRDKLKMVTLCNELIAEAKHKIHQTDSFRDDMSRRLGFQIGMVMGEIREKYKSMLEIYRQTHNKYTGKANLKLPNFEYRPIHYVLRMEYISHLELDIDRLVHVLEQLPLQFLEDSGSSETGERPRGLRAGRTSAELEAFLAAQERAVKRGYRQQYLRSRLAASGDSLHAAT